MDAHSSAIMDAHSSGEATGEATGVLTPSRPAYNRSDRLFVGPQEKQTSNRSMGAALRSPIDMLSVCFQLAYPGPVPNVVHGLTNDVHGLELGVKRVGIPDDILREPKDVLLMTFLGWLP